MALVNCPECGKANVSDSAQACPDCGYGIKDHFIKIAQERAAVALAAQKALEKKEAEEKAKEEREKRIENVKKPDPPKKPIAMVAGVLAIGIMWLFVAFIDGFRLFWFIGGVFFCVASLGGVFDYQEKMKKYEIAQSDFKQYQQMIVNEEDNKRAAAARVAEQKAAQALEKARAVPKCPKCGSTYLSTVNRGYSLIWGFVGSGKPMNVCQKCGHKFKPGT